MIVFEFVKCDYVKFIDADRILRNEKIVANTHATKKTIVENLESVHKGNLLGFGFHYPTIEKVNWLVERSFCVCC